MLGAILVFAATCLVVGCWMTVIHKVLKAAEEPGDFPQRVKTARPVQRKFDRPAARTQLAH